MIKYTISSLFVAAFVSAASFTAFSQENGGSEAMAFAKIERSPVSAGKGFASIASSTDAAWASFNNPSILPLSKNKTDIKAIYQNWAPAGVHTTDLGLGAGFKFSDKFGLALGGVMRNGQAYELLNDMGVSKGKFSPKDLQLALGFGVAIKPFLSIGLNAKFLNSSLSPAYKYSAVAGDLIATGVFGDFKVAAGVADLGASVKSVEGRTFNLPTSVVAGADYSRVLGGKHYVDASFDANYLFNGGITAAFGMQYGFNDMIFLRGGYHFGTAKAPLPSFATLGAGLKFFGISIDAAYILGNDFLKNTLTIGLGYSF